MITTDALKNYTPEELTEVVTHQEACEMFLDLASNVNDLDAQMERMITHATALEFENKSLKILLSKFDIF